MSKKAKTATFASARALQTLASPLRMDLLQAFTPEENLTVQEIAERVGKSQSSLYYHIRKLVEIGVLVEVERRLKGRRYESVYRIAAERIEIEADPASSVQKELVSRLVSSILRKVAREFQSALEAGALSEEEAAQVGRRQRAWLSEADVSQINTHLDRIEKICAKGRPSEGRRLHSILNLVIPLEE